MKNFFAVLLIIAALSSCKKEETRDIEKAAARLEGTWRVSEVRLRQTDTMGTTVKDTVVGTGGTVEFRIASGEDDDVFNVALFEGGADATELVGYFSSKAAGNGTTAGGWSLYWDADPEDVRVQFWGITAGGSYHRGINLTGDGDSRELFYVVETPGMAVRNFYTWKMSKQ